MTNKRFLTGALTATLLSMIALTVFWGATRRSGTVTAQSEPARSGNIASIQRLGLAEMVDRAGKIFRGTLVDFQPTTVEAGGGSLPAVEYTFRVEQSFKGSFQVKDGVTYSVVRMLGNVKQAPDSGTYKRLSPLPELPSLRVGSDYLLMLTPESSVGLTAPVGLGQGTFTVYEMNKQVWANNELDNAGLFDGPVEYSKLATMIRRAGGTRK